MLLLLGFFFIIFTLYSSWLWPHKTVVTYITLKLRHYFKLLSINKWVTMLLLYIIHVYINGCKQDCFSPGFLLMWHHTTLHDEEEHCLQRLKVWENTKVCNRNMFARNTTALPCSLISEINIIRVMHIICKMSLNTCNCKHWSSLFYIPFRIDKESAVEKMPGVLKRKFSLWNLQ